MVNDALIEEINAAYRRLSATTEGPGMRRPRAGRVRPESTPG